MAAFSPPPDYPRITVVGSFEELVAVPFRGTCNAVCWQRDLAGDFDEVVRRLTPSADLATIEPDRLRALPVSAAGRTAVDTLVADLQRLRAIGHEPLLECVRAYERDPGPLPTDVYSFHVDRADAPTDTYLCTYAGSASEGLRNDQARRCVDVPAVRTQLLAQFGDTDDAAFAAFLAENSFDLHYTPLPGAQPFDFGRGNLWRIAVQHRDSLVPACIHRAPANLSEPSPRLLLIS
jgi:hypothetical protein